MKPSEPSSSSSSFPSPLPSSSSSKDWTYDVFLSFRGEDNRHGFTDHLYEALNVAGVRTFRDAEELRRGENIAEELVWIIQGCRISLIVFSENYANSSWCLEELVQIMECRNTLGQLVFPIFYHVDPSDVRYQRGSFAMAFGNTTNPFAFNFPGRRLSWSAALHEAASLSGWHLGIDGSEVETIKRIVKQIRSGLNITYLKEAKYPVGIVQHVEDICKCLGDVGSDNNDVRMVGIWGMAGIGKTAVAKAIYNKFYHDFDSRSFLQDVTETAKDEGGIIALQERLLSDVLKPTKIEIRHVARGINVIKQQLGRKKVLVIVDDVTDKEQLYQLACERDSFGQGSIIIITTRDRLLLQQLQVHPIHPIREMPEASALELFSWHAFQMSSPDVGFDGLSKSVVDYCGGLPLALEVLGSFLYGSERGEWQRTLEKLKKFPHAKIQSKLRISYDAMDWNQKEIFLHISCFLIGMDKNYAIQILEGCGLSAESDISVLLHRCLLTVSEKNKLMMHDLLRDMGREVVRAEFPTFHEKRSRLWCEKDIIEDDIGNLDEDIGKMISLRTLLVSGTSITEIPSSVESVLLPRLDFSSRDSLNQQTTGPSHD